MGILLILKRKKTNFREIDVGGFVLSIYKEIDLDDFSTFVKELEKKNDADLFSHYRMISEIV